MNYWVIRNIQQLLHLEEKNPFSQLNSTLEHIFDIFDKDLGIDLSIKLSD
jgi:hypothetical protein